MKSIKYLVVLVCMTLGMTDVALAQIRHSNDDVLYYISSSGKGMRMCRFDGDKVYETSGNTDDVKTNLRTNPEYYDNQIPIYVSDDKKSIRSKNHREQIDVGLFDKDNRIPNSSKEVYIESISGFGTSEVLAFSKDLSSLVVFYVNSGFIQTGNIYYFTRISKEDLMDNTNDFDFLND